MIRRLLTTPLFALLLPSALALMVAFALYPISIAPQISQLEHSRSLLQQELEQVRPIIREFNQKEKQVDLLDFFYDASRQIRKKNRRYNDFMEALLSANSDYHMTLKSLQPLIKQSSQSTDSDYMKYTLELSSNKTSSLYDFSHQLQRLSYIHRLEFSENMDSTYTIHLNTGSRL